MAEVPVSQVQAFEKAFLGYMKDQKAKVRTDLLEKKDLTPEVKEALIAAIADFKKSWKPAGK